MRERIVMAIDELDARLLDLLAAEPRVGVLEASRRLRVARGTVQARLDKMQRSGVIGDLAPTLDPAALGFPVTAFLSLEIAQHQGRSAVVQHLSGIEEVIEAHTITGSADLLVRLVARDNTDLQRVIDEVVSDPLVLRAATVVSLTTEIAHRTGPLVHAALSNGRRALLSEADQARHSGEWGR
jgi:DNA-binding Lrp family transcriptional regulator